MKILFFGDIVGRVGRSGVKQILPQLKEKYQPDIIIANGENLAHGVGITPKTVQEMLDAGIDIFTSGNHVWDKPNGEEILQADDPAVIRPLNYGDRKSGIGYKEIVVGEKKLLAINLQGQVFMADETDNPFIAIDKFFSSHAPKNYDAIFIDFHAEATSEKVAMGWHVDGRASVLAGTHTHIPTADAKILPDGTAYISDVGMTGASDSVIGVNKEGVLSRFKEDANGNHFEYAEEGKCGINAIFVEIGEQRKAKNIKLLQFNLET